MVEAWAPSLCSEAEDAPSVNTTPSPRPHKARCDPVGGSPRTTDTESGDYDYNTVMDAEDFYCSQETPFGRALRQSLEGALPIVRSGLNLQGWLRMLAEELEDPHATAAAELYLRLSRGWQVLPPDAEVELQWTRNYVSENDAVAGAHIDAELLRLQTGGHLLTFDEAQAVFPSLRGMDRPTVILAMGCVVKIVLDPAFPGGKTKTRVVLDCSAPHDGTSLNARMDVPDTKLAAVRQARAGVAELSQDGDEVWGFKCDMTDAFLQIPTAESSVRLLPR